ncbi:MAG: PAC2 family protein [Dehalogenimonas sp.]|uniref:PAC2 family protein n=1 Tax=Candidatus Dehalogenimonas loeffleri TaxID=3127115 RepID=A0ABZ2J441_9CHLR|nr:PAC2 family protein [Dehalogenimonas sp.]
MTGQLKYSAAPRLERPLMVVAWSGETGNLGQRIIGYLNDTLQMAKLADIEPGGFFGMNSVEVSSDLVSFPESVLRYSEKASLITMYSDVPAYEVPEFLKLVLDVAARYGVSQLVLVNGLPVMASHNTPSELIANLNTPLLKEWLSGDGVNTEINYESPPGQRPPISSYLIWEARQRGIEAVSLWVPVPYYLAPYTDEVGARRTLAFLREKLALALDLDGAVDAEQRLREQLGALRTGSADVDRALTMLESNMSLTEYEAGQLAAAVREKIGQEG